MLFSLVVKCVLRLNHAEVELIFDNRDHQLASDDDEVVVTKKNFA